jgi:hypothetical protein
VGSTPTIGFFIYIPKKNQFKFNCKNHYQKNPPVIVGVTLLFFFMHYSTAGTVLWSVRCPVWHSPLSLIHSPFYPLKELFQISKLQSAPPVAKKSPFFEKAQVLIEPLCPYIL